MVWENVLGAGSSPLTRGKRFPGDADLAALGLIPAHAGKTLSSLVAVRARGAHPRSRGENGVGTGTGSVVTGSSPLTRGKPRSLSLSSTRSGLIPAHAGKTLVEPYWIGTMRAHPRSRGENASVFLGVAWSVGSSPLTRGKHLCADAVAWDQGLIPAHAGKTVLGAITGTINGAHPRSRGENGSRPGEPWTSWGSSPLTRGKRLTTSALVSTPRAHPRSRGENSSARIAPSAGGGSSPLTRGKPDGSGTA